MRQYSQAMDKHFKQLISVIKSQAAQPQAVVPQPYSYQQLYQQGNPYNANTSNIRQYPNGCFYCKETGHKIYNCPTALKHLDLKWIKQVDRLLKLPDGLPLSTNSDKSCKDLVEQLYKNRPGIIPMAKVNMQSFYPGKQCQDNMSPDMQDPSVSQLLSGLAQLLGRDAVDRMLDEERQPLPLDGVEEEIEGLLCF